MSKRSDLLVRVRYLNPVPNPPFPPKLLSINTDINRLGEPSKFDELQRLLKNDFDERSKKRKRDHDHPTALQIIQDVFPTIAVDGDVANTLLQNDSLSLPQLAETMPNLVCNAADCHRHTASSSNRNLGDQYLDLWIRVGQADNKALRVLGLIMDHMSTTTLATGMQLSHRQVVLEKLFVCLKSEDRSTRLVAGRNISLLFVAQRDHPSSRVAERNRQTYVDKIAKLLTCKYPIRETAILTLGDIGRHLQPQAICPVLKCLIQQLGSPSGPLRSLAYTELLGLTAHHHKTPYTLISPFLEDISVLLAENLARAPDMVVETMQFIGQARQNFFITTLSYTLPALVLSRNAQAVQALSSAVKQQFGVLLLDNIAGVLSKIFLHPVDTDASLKFLLKIVVELTGRNANQPPISITSLMTACMVDFIVSLVVELGDETKSTQNTAKNALVKAQQAVSPDKSSDLGVFLKPHMLGVISQLNDMLHDVHGKKTAAYKCKIIRSLGVLITLVGDSMASFSPQIMASLQSTLGINELRRETLNTWKLFITTLRFSDVGPFVGRTTGALVANWRTFTMEERKIALQIANEIADNVKQLSEYIDEVVGMDNIPELKSAAARLTAQRRGWTLKEQLNKILDRTESKNVAIATASMHELRRCLHAHQDPISMFAQGDTFDQVTNRLLNNILSAATRDGDCQELRDVSYECIGIVGALDPDRLGAHTESAAMTLSSNFADKEETLDFALHLIRELLVDVFRATTDTKHQTHIAYAIQELLKFCGFTPKILHPGSSTSVKVKARWHTLPKDHLETLSPLLESRFSISDASYKSFTHPIYSAAPTYREWLQMWTSDLIGKVMSMNGDDISTRDSKAIFGVFRGILRYQDVTVAHHILPHLVLNVLLTGIASYNHQICQEINAVLQDQVNPVGSPDKRSLSAQVIFDLMDHLSKWLRRNRVSRSDRGHHAKIVENVLSSIETELMANAALRSKAFARSLRSFEQRIIQLRNEKRENTELQTYFERLHEIYAELDEPDGMEGVSAFVISPSLEHQIREHESTGRWTSAQSCWEVRLQQSPDDLSLHVGLLKCLRNLGHYDTLRTHIRGVLSRQPAWSTALASFEAEAAWIIGDWSTVEQLGHYAPPVGQALLALKRQDGLQPVLERVRRDIGRSITAKHYGGAYESILQLHMIEDISMIQRAKNSMGSAPVGPNRVMTQRDITTRLKKLLGIRSATTSPAFRVQEAILSIRRTAYSVLETPWFQSEIGESWIMSAKIARKAGYEQTAYSATLQAKEADAPFAFIQQAKLLRAHGGVFKALTDLENALPMLKNKETSGEPDFARHRDLAKATLLMARWTNDTERFGRNEIVNRYLEAINLSPELESPYYHLGHYYDSKLVSSERVAYAFYTCRYYSQALEHGVKYIFQTMPRMLTLWLDLGELEVPGDAKSAGKGKQSTKKSGTEQTSDATYAKLTKIVDDARKRLPPYQFLTAFPQIVSRIGHPNENVADVVMKIMATVIQKYPQQAMWSMVGVMQSKRPDRKAVCEQVLRRASSDPSVDKVIKDARQLSSALLQFTDEKVEDKKREMSISLHYDYVHKAVPTSMILPLQDALTCTLPTSAETVRSHNPFPVTPVGINGFEDRIEIMPSLQKPKKLVFIGTDGRRYPFLCKPHDDLRKDARLMDMNSMINKLLKSASESRRRQLYIRTYAVMPLNEECGLLEWVSNTSALKSILEKGYGRYGKKVYSNEVYNLCETARKSKKADAQVEMFKDVLLPMFMPSVFHEWFLTTWPEPTAWMASRLAYGRTLAVMSMIGYVLGLGDRHGENILFDGLTGDTVHVDLNCLFDKGKTFEIPERVPFRLTHNMVDALGVTGVEGVFRKAAEITMGILRSNSDSLMSVLEAFVHDPLVEWTKSNRKGDKDIRTSADKNLRPIKAKLKGVEAGAGAVVSVPSQVEALIKQAISPATLCGVYRAQCMLDGQRGCR